MLALERESFDETGQAPVWRGLEMNGPTLRTVTPSTERFAGPGRGAFGKVCDGGSFAFAGPWGRGEQRVDLSLGNREKHAFTLPSPHPGQRSRKIRWESGDMLAHGRFRIHGRSGRLERKAKLRRP